MTINWKELKDKVGREVIVVNCTNKEDIKDLFENLHELGYKWSTKESLIEKIHYPYLDETCYCINIDGSLTYENIDWFKSNDYEVYEYRRSDIDMRKSELKTGMVVKIKSGDNFIVIHDTIGHDNESFVGESILIHHTFKVIPLSDYDNDLKHKEDSIYNIVEVRTFHSILDSFRSWDYNDLLVVWRRLDIQYVVGNHFGSTKEYHWKTQFGEEYNTGDIVEVETSKGNQLVEVKRTYYADESDKYKNVIRKVVI